MEAFPAQGCSCLGTETSSPCIHAWRTGARGLLDRNVVILRNLFLLFHCCFKPFLHLRCSGDTCGLLTLGHLNLGHGSDRFDGDLTEYRLSLVALGGTMVVSSLVLNQDNPEVTHLACGKGELPFRDTLADS